MCWNACEILVQWQGTGIEKASDPQRQFTEYATQKCDSVLAGYVKELPISFSI